MRGFFVASRRRTLVELDDRHKSVRARVRSLLRLDEVFCSRMRRLPIGRCAELHVVRDVATVEPAVVIEIGDVEMTKQVYASNDGTRFQRIGEAQSKSQAESQAMRLAPTALVRHPSGTLMAYASRVIDGTAQSASVVQQSDGSWLVRERHADENVAAKKVAAAWGGPAGTACCASLAGMSLQVFEGGDASPREHVLCVRVPAIVSVPAVK